MRKTLSANRWSRSPSRIKPLLGFLALLLLIIHFKWDIITSSSPPPHAASTLAKCQSLDLKPDSLRNAHDRQHSDRFEPGTKPVLVKNARIWTGVKNGTEIVNGNIFLDKGIIQRVGKIDLASLPSDTVVLDAKNAWVTPGIVDMHSHLGDSAIPALRGADDTNSFNGLVQPWLRSLDALNTHDESYPLSIAGGVTSALVLPGSNDAIGGQGFTIKLRKTKAKTPQSMLLEPPYNINISFPDPNLPLRWRQMKHACGENLGHHYVVTRMDAIWAFREAYNKAREIKSAQDLYCSRAIRGEWKQLGNSVFPEDLQWEALVDVLRGRVKVHVHCYEAVDLDALIRLSNEFEIPIAAVHHAAEAYLVSSTLKKAYGKPPAAALFALWGRCKREAYRFSEFSPRILNDNGIQVVMKSDHPELNSRYLLFEAQLAYYYGLEKEKALSAVTSYPAEVLGLGWRVGYIREGFDAGLGLSLSRLQIPYGEITSLDLVVWDSHPLALGATPTQVFIDGIPQLEAPYMVRKPSSFQEAPDVPNFDEEVKDTMRYDGLPPLEPKRPKSNLMIFSNVHAVWTKNADGIVPLFEAQNRKHLATVLVDKGVIVCTGAEQDCLSRLTDSDDAEVVDLKGGEISPAFISFGSPLGLSYISQEESTNDGFVYDELKSNGQRILAGTIVKAADGLQFGTRDAFYAYREGVTTGITAPSHHGLLGGLSCHFSTGASHRLEKGAVWRNTAGLHVTVRHLDETPGVSTQIALLRKLLLGGGEDDAREWWRSAAEGRIPLVVEAHSADVIATLLLLKKEIEGHHWQHMKLTITGASEAHLLAKELAEAGVGVILNPARPFPITWERRRILPGPPITAQSAIAKLLSHNVTVGVGVEGAWEGRRTRLDVAWASIEAGGQITQQQALALGSTNIEKLLTGWVNAKGTELVATEAGGILDMNSRVVAILSSTRGVVDLF